MIKQVTLSGEELKVEGIGGRNAVIVNFGSADLYASAYPDIVPDGKNVAAISAGSAINLPDTNGTVYLLGTGKVQLEGTDYGTVNISLSSGGSGGGGTPTAEIMPHMDGIVGYFTPDTLDIPGGRWKNALNGNDIILSGGSAENECLHLTKDDFGSLTTDEPMTIYALFKTNLTGTEYNSVYTEYYSILSKHMTTTRQYREFAIVVSPDIMLSCRSSLVQSDISALAVHCACITRNASIAKLYIDGKYQGETRAELGDYNGEYLLNKSLRGSGFGDQWGDYSYKMLAFGSEEHTPEQIAQNSAWLANKIFRW